MQTRRDGARLMLRLDDGQDLFVALTDIARREKIGAGVVTSGIGMLREATIGYWNGKEYGLRALAQPHELVGLHGSIAKVDGNPSVHLHAALAGPDHQLIGGHLVRGTIGILGEVFVETFPGPDFGRPLNESLGLRALDLDPGPT